MAASSQIIALVVFTSLISVSLQQISCYKYVCGSIADRNKCIEVNESTKTVTLQQCPAGTYCYLTSIKEPRDTTCVASTDIPIHVPTNKLPAGYICKSNDQCRSGRCVSEDYTQNDTEYDDAIKFCEGAFIGDKCSDETICDAGLYCDDLGYCKETSKNEGDACCDIALKDSYSQSVKERICNDWSLRAAGDPNIPDNTTTNYAFNGACQFQLVCAENACVNRISSSSYFTPENLTTNDEEAFFTDNEFACRSLGKFYVEKPSNDPDRLEQCADSNTHGNIPLKCSSDADCHYNVGPYNSVTNSDILGTISGSCTCDFPNPQGQAYCSLRNGDPHVEELFKYYGYIFFNRCTTATLNTKDSLNTKCWYRINEGREDLAWMSNQISTESCYTHIVGLKYKENASSPAFVASLFVFLLALVFAS